MVNFLGRFDVENQKPHSKECLAATLCAKASKNSSKSGSYKDHNILILGKEDKSARLR